MELGTIQIEYEDGTIVEGVIPDGLMLASAKWIDWLVMNNDPENNTTEEGNHE